MTLRFSRALFTLGHDILMAGLAFAVAVVLRVGWSYTTEQIPHVLMVGTPMFALVAAGVFLGTGMYRGIWRYASLEDTLAILRAASLTVLISVALMFLVTRLDDLPRSSLVIAWFTLVFLLSAPRLIYRVAKDGHFRHLLRRTPEARRIPILLIGAGDEADQFIRTLARDPNAAYRPIGIVDERGRRVGRAIRNVPVLGQIDEIPQIVAQLTRRALPPQRLIITRERMDPETADRLLDYAQKLALPLSRLPRLTDFKRQADSAGRPLVDVRPIAIEDLLGRPQAALDRDAMAALIGGARVLVTGAGGSIGSELVRQVAAFGPAELTLLDAGEYALYQIDLEMAERHPDLPRRAVLADVRDRRHLAARFAEIRPDLVFHAAALKHVPLVEANPTEAVLTNAIGTRHVADLARAHKVRAMVLISTDKAVNPANVMGATKRLAEAYAQALDLDERRRARAGGEAPTRFVTVRFGNVLGSTGSVVPLFQRQLAAGGPLTVTHPDMTRFFMTIREAVELVLQAMTLGVADAGSKAGDAGDADASDGGAIHVLDMGAPVRIVDLARQMIRLAGLRPDRDIAIRFTGLRPGEKLHEELFHAEELVESGSSGIRLARPRTADLALLGRGLDELDHLARARRDTDVALLLSRLVPEFQMSELAGAVEPPVADQLRSLGKIP